MSTHGAEMVSLNAFIKTLEFYKKKRYKKNMLFGQNLKVISILFVMI